MGKRKAKLGAKVKCLSESPGAMPPTGATSNVRTSKAVPGRLQSPVCGGVRGEGVAKLPKSDTKCKESSQDSQSARDHVPTSSCAGAFNDWAAARRSSDAQGTVASETPTLDVPNMVILSTLQKLEAKIDDLRSTVEDIPVKITEIMRQIFVTKGHDCLKNYRTSLERISPETDGDYNGNRFLLSPLPVSGGEQSMCLQAVFTDGQVPEQTFNIQTLCPEEKERVESLVCDQPGPGQNHTLPPTLPDGQDPDQNYMQGPQVPSVSLGLNNSSAAGGGIIESLTRRNANPVASLFNAPQESLWEEPVFIERMKEDPSVIHQGFDTGERMTEETQLSVTDPQSLERKGSVRDSRNSEKEVVLNSQEFRETVLFRDIHLEARKENAVQTHKDSEEERFIKMHDGLGEGPSVRVHQRTEEHPCIRLSSGLEDESSSRVHHSGDGEPDEEFDKRPLGTLAETCPSTKKRKKRRRRNARQQGVHASLEEEQVVSCSTPRKRMEENPSATFQTAQTLRSHSKSSEDAFVKDLQSSKEKEGRTTEDGKSTRWCVTNSEGQQNVAEKEPLLGDQQEEAIAEMEEKAPSIDDQQENAARDWTEDEDMCEERMESTFAGELKNSITELNKTLDDCRKELQQKKVKKCRTSPPDYKNDLVYTWMEVYNIKPRRKIKGSATSSEISSSDSESHHQALGESCSKPGPSEGIRTKVNLLEATPEPLPSSRGFVRGSKKTKQSKKKKR
ncbi:uncharacterized protein [Ambystoma mexicanum]|uniref:uncharacterized protein n=1 Tax=Ambystoma mexicanum TaxID=8296 RepID=UPI0037E77942